MIIGAEKSKKENNNSNKQNNTNTLGYNYCPYSKLYMCVFSKLLNLLTVSLSLM